MRQMTEELDFLFFFHFCSRGGGSRRVTRFAGGIFELPRIGSLIKVGLRAQMWAPTWAEAWGLGAVRGG